MKQNGEFKDSVLVADPQSLGQFREAMHKGLEASLVLTFAKKLTNHPIADIADAFR